MAALGVLGAIPAGTLPPDPEGTRQVLARQADRMCEEGSWSWRGTTEGAPAEIPATGRGRHA